MADQIHSGTAAVPKSGPPAVSVGAIGWLRANLFNTWYNSLLTLVILWMLIEVVPGLVAWLTYDAVWQAGPPEICDGATGACWAFIHEKARFMLFGLYPFDEQWRPTLAVLLAVGLIVASANRALWGRAMIGAWAVGAPAIWILMSGGVFGLTSVPNTQWGGLPLTLGLSFIGLAVAFPVGILLALGRRSNLPAIRTFCVIYIELIRGVPLITILFMASVMIPLFFPTDMTIDKLLRAQIGMIMFAAAYLAEVVRGGLQAIPKGQYEAADSLGLTYWQKMRQIILPQALTISIPPLVNTFIGFFKDTSLVVIIGLFDLLGATKTALTEPGWRSMYKEAYIFIALIYWAFCYSMSKYSQALERKLETGRARR
jgi:general L-amino acid transport system permease protein